MRQRPLRQPRWRRRVATTGTTTAPAITMVTTALTGESTNAPGTPDTPGVAATTSTAAVTTTVPAPTPGAESPSTTLPLILIGIVAVVAIVGIGWWMSRSSPANGPAVPSIRPILITYAPPAGSSAQVVGTVDPGLRADHRVLVYINVRGRWWGPKPGGEEPFTRIDPDGTWRCTIFTGGEDHLASEIAAYLVPSTLTAAPPAEGIRSTCRSRLRVYPFVNANR